MSQAEPRHCPCWQPGLARSPWGPLSWELAWCLPLPLGLKSYKTVESRRGQEEIPQPFSLVLWSARSASHG